VEKGFLATTYPKGMASPAVAVSQNGFSAASYRELPLVDFGESVLTSDIFQSTWLLHEAGMFARFSI
jgi:hypothetical protein